MFVSSYWSFLDILRIWLANFRLLLIFEEFGGFGFEILDILIDLILEEKLLKLLFFNWG